MWLMVPESLLDVKFVALCFWEEKGNRKTVEASVCSHEQLFYIIAARLLCNRSIQIGYPEIIISSHPLALLHDEAMDVKSFEQVPCYSGTALTSIEFCILDDVKLVPDQCYFLGLCLDKSYSILQAQRPGPV